MYSHIWFTVTSVLAFRFRYEYLFVAITVTDIGVDTVCMGVSVARPLRSINCHINTAGTYTKLTP
jgi:hypothetical protein